MDDSDDYFDDLVLDDRTLAALDQVESQYVTTQLPNAAPAREPTRAIRVDRPPPTKRQKTAHPSLKRALSEDDHEDLPEISVQGDNYRVARPKSPATNGVAHRTNSFQAPLSRPAQAKPAGAGPSSRTHVAGATSRQPQLMRQPSGPVFNAQGISAPHAPRGIQRRQSSQSVFGSQHAPRSTQKGPEFVSKMEIEILRAQLDEVHLSRSLVIKAMLIPIPQSSKADKPTCSGSFVKLRKHGSPSRAKSAYSELALIKYVKPLLMYLR